MGRRRPPHPGAVQRGDRALRVVFLGKHKRSAARALELLVERGCEVAAVAIPPAEGTEHPSQRVDAIAERHGLSLLDASQVHDRASALEGVDLVVSFLFPLRIRPPLIDLPRVACLNFHPAPLPDMRGLGGINVAIVEGWKEWGVSAHHVAESFDTGDLVEVERFPLDAATATALSLDLESQERLVELFTRVVDRALAGEELPREPQGEGRYVTREEFEGLRRVRDDDGPEDVERRIRAFWYPPHPGATIERGGRAFTLVDERALSETAAAMRAAGVVT